ncbi:hypothetical protein [uncultured Metabacillus sp.]|uniref:hypothetical protein n=1 Tax=uncultured Metabacillus sp. TaxID=2860135 RepID=UPI002635FF27|nr:hypothetical protein [uncultured Metabacillus sp.]
MKNLAYIIITLIIWILSAIFLFSNGIVNVSPWVVHDFVNITIQILAIFLPIIGLVLSILINSTFAE